MPRRITGFVASIIVLAAGLAATCQPANAFLLDHHPKVDRRVEAVSLGAGIASTLGYFAMRDWTLGGGDAHNTVAQAWGVTSAACMVLSPIVAGAIVRERELTQREVWVMEGSCLIPIVGGILVNALWDAHPEWEAAAPRPAAVPVRVVHKRHTRSR
jgi:hypothetical protein